MGVSVVDIACGMFAYDNVLLALIARGVNGLGARFEVTLFDALAQWLAVPYLLDRYAGAAPARVGLNHPGIAPYGVFVSEDRMPFVLAIQNEREWLVLAALLGREDWAADPRTSSNAARLANRALVDGAVADWAAAQPWSTLTARLTERDIAHAPVNPVSALKQHLDFRTQSVLVNGERIEVPITPGAEPQDSAPLPALPALGAHTAEVLAELNSG